MSKDPSPIAISLISEIMIADQLLRGHITRAMPKGMELSHFTVLNQLAHIGAEKTPAQLAKVLHLTRGAMTNTLNKLEIAGYIHIRPDWDDARRKLVSISPAGRLARDAALASVSPIIDRVARHLGDTNVRAVLPILRELRISLEQDS